MYNKIVRSDGRVWTGCSNSFTNHRENVSPCTLSHSSFNVNIIDLLFKIKISQLKLKTQTILFPCQAVRLCSSSGIKLMERQTNLCKYSLTSSLPTCVCVRHILRRSAVCNLIPRVNNVRLNVQYVLDALLKEKLCWIIHHCTIEKKWIIFKGQWRFYLWDSVLSHQDFLGFLNIVLFLNSKCVKNLPLVFNISTNKVYIFFFLLLFNFCGIE